MKLLQYAAVVLFLTLVSFLVGFLILPKYLSPAPQKEGDKVQAAKPTSLVQGSGSTTTPSDTNTDGSTSSTTPPAGKPAASSGPSLDPISSIPPSSDSNVQTPRDIDSDKPSGASPAAEHEPGITGTGKGTKPLVQGKDSSASASKSTTPKRRESSTEPRRILGSGETASPGTKSTGKGRYRVIAGSFSTKESADKHSADLKEQGFDAYVSPFRTRSGETLYRVQAGVYANEKGAADQRKKLEEKGFQTTISN